MYGGKENDHQHHHHHHHHHGEQDDKITYACRLMMDVELLYVDSIGFLMKLMYHNDCVGRGMTYVW